MKKTIAYVVSTLIALSGCAANSTDIRSVYISPLQYNSYDCDQISAEMARIQVRVSELGGRLDSAASNDKALVAVGMVLFWPALFVLGGNKDKEAEFSRLKGELEAVQQASIAKKCMVQRTTTLPMEQKAETKTNS